MRHIFENEFDKFSAENVEHATKLRDALYGFEPGSEESTSDPFEPVDDDVVFSVCFVEDDPEFVSLPDWVKSEPEAKAEKLAKSDAFNGSDRFRVTAPARVWAKHIVGMVCSSEW
jgi:hypothetical protein